MAGTGKKWLIGCGVGCGVAIVLAIVITIGSAIVMTRPFNKAVEAQQELVRTLGDREDYVAPPGAISAARIERFLAVREALQPMCARFGEIAEDFTAMDEMDKVEDPPIGDILKNVGNLMGSTMGIAGAIGGVTQARNEALLEQQMSLGEFVWIYILVYHSWLGEMPGTDFAGDEGGNLSTGAARVMRTLMENHAAELERSGDPATADLWRDEIARWKRSDLSAPFADTDLPEGLAETLEPYRADLVALYCPEMAAFELDQIKKKGFGSFSSE